MTQKRFERLHRTCSEILATLWPRYHFREQDRKDIEQAMAVGLLEADEAQSDGFCLVRAVWAAGLWLRKERKWHRNNVLRDREELTALADYGRPRRVWC